MMPLLLLLAAPGQAAARSLLIGDVTPLAWSLGLVAAGLILALYLFFTVKREISILAARWNSKAQKMQRVIEELSVGVKEAGEHAATVVPPPPRPGFNLNTRSQALRMFRRGDQPEQIAALLRIPENEVRLLLKIHQLSAE